MNQATSILPHNPLDLRPWRLIEAGAADNRDPAGASEAVRLPGTQAEAACGDAPMTLLNDARDRAGGARRPA